MVKRWFVSPIIPVIQSGVPAIEVVSASDYDAAQARIRELEALVRMAWGATLDFRTTYNGRPSNFRESEIQTAQSLCDCNDALDSFLYPEDSQSDREAK